MIGSKTSTKHWVLKINEFKNYLNDVKNKIIEVKWMMEHLTRKAEEKSLWNLIKVSSGEIIMLSQKENETNRDSFLIKFLRRTSNSTLS